MNCRTAYSWVLANPTSETPPAGVSRHLDRCAACERRRQRLLGLDRAAKSFAASVDHSAARMRLLELVATTPQEQPPLKLKPASPVAFGWRRLALAAAACLVIGLALGYFLSRRPDLPAPVAHDRTPSNEPGKRTPESDRLSRGETIRRIVLRDTRLAETEAADQQARVLVDMAEDLQDAVIGSVKDGATDGVPVVTVLHEQVVRGGMVRAVSRIPESRRAATLPSLATRLQQSAARLTKAAETELPAVADLLRGMGTTCADVAAALQQPKLPEPSPLASDVNRPGAPLLATLVYGGLRLADDPDPLRRADTCTDVADALVQSIVLASAAGDAERSDELGKSLGEFLDKGLSVNLGRVPSDLPASRQAEFDRVKQRAAKATGALERNLERAPAPAKAGLERALEASRHGRERAAEAGKGKGKGKGKKPDHAGPKDGRGGPPKGPPGLEKRKPPINDEP